MTLNELAKECHKNAREHGFWHIRSLLGDDWYEWRPSVITDAGMRVALVHSEVSELLEALRHRNPPSDHVPEITLAEEEAADTIIRLLDMAGAYGWDLDNAVAKKMEYNEGRPAMHGKAF